MYTDSFIKAGQMWRDTTTTASYYTTFRRYYN